jgi:CRISPR-associated endonuclease Cas1
MAQLATVPNFTSEPGRDDYYVVHGFPAIRVESGHLIIEDGTPRGSRVRRISRIERTLKRIIIPARHGGITFDALDWLREVGISLYVLRDGHLMTASTYSHQDAALLRSQARAIDRPVGLKITKYLLEHKLKGQAQVAGMLTSEETAAWIVSQMDKIETRKTIVACGLLEGGVARRYWESWHNEPIFWRDNVRAHWETFGTRHSALGGGMSPRYACNPANAMLNYAYGTLEAEVTIACWSLGLNPILGISHKDEAGRVSMVHDLMEPVRPAVDALLLDWIRTQTFNTGQFVESKTGVARIKDDGLLTEIVGIVKDAYADRMAHFEWVAHRLVEEAEGKRTNKRTPLTQQNRRDGLKR